MFEIDDPARRARELARLGGIENHAFIEIGGERIRGEPDPTRENTSPDGKASSVQFLRFPFSPAQIAAFKAPGARVLVGSIIRITAIWRRCPSRSAPPCPRISTRPVRLLRYSEAFGRISADNAPPAAREGAVPTYVMLANWTDQGARNVKDRRGGSKPRRSR